jgi:hypothetical protein
LDALETATEIIFSDKSAVIRRSHYAWRSNYSRMRTFTGETEAVRFILELDRAAAFVALAQARFF